MGASLGTPGDWRLLSERPAVRKDWRQTELLVQFHREMEVAYCRLVTISTDRLSETNDRRGRSTRAVLVGCRTNRLEGPRYCGIHGPSPQSDDSAHDYS